MDKSELGFGMAGFILSMALFTTLIRKQIITTEEAIRTIDVSRALTQKPDFYPGDPQILQASDQALQIVRNILRSLSSQPSSGDLS